MDKSMFKKLGLLILGLTLILPAAHAQESPPAAVASVRFGNVAAAGVAVDLFLNGEPLWRNLAFSQTTFWLDLPVGDHDLLLLPSGVAAEKRPLYTGIISIAADSLSTLLVIGTADDLKVHNINESMAATAEADFARYYFFNAMPDRLLGIVVNATVTVADLAYAATPILFEDVAEGYAIQLIAAEDQATVYADFWDRTYTPQTNTLFILTLQDDQPTPLVLSTDLQGSLSVRHWSIDEPSVDVYINGEKVVEGLFFNDPSPILTYFNGEYTVALVAAGQSFENPFWGPQNLMLRPNKTLTLVINRQRAADVFIQPALDPWFLAQNDVLSGKNALIRLYHGVPEIPAVDIRLADGTVLLEDLAYGETQTIALPDGSIDLELVLREAGVILYRLPNTLLKGGTVYQAAIMGRAVEVQNNSQPLYWQAECVLPQGC
jgi:hypothetical protein